MDNQIESKDKKDHDIDDFLTVPHLNPYDYIIDARLHDECNDNKPKIKKKHKIIEYWKFIIMIILSGCYSFVEITIGYLYGSIALQTDGFHMLSNMLALIVALCATIMSQKSKSNKVTYGWIRAEILGGLINAIFLLSPSILLVIQAIYRLIKFKDDNFGLVDHIDLLLIIAGTGLGISVFGIILFLFNNKKTKNHSHNLNVRSLMLHIIGDLLGSIGVVSSGLLIKYLDSPYRFLCDPLVALLIVIFVTGNTIPIIKKCCKILLHIVPKDIDINDIRNNILKIENVKDLHHLHIWQLNDLRIISTMHIVINADNNRDNIKKTVENILHKNNIHSTTIQFENIADKRCDNYKCDNENCNDLACCDDSIN